MSRTHLLRAVVVVLFAVFAYGGPFVEQVLHIEVQPIKSWRMYTGYGVGQCIGAFYNRTDGELEKIDHLALVRGVDHWTEQRYHRRRIREEDLDWWARQLCRERSVRDLRADLRCVNRRRWKQVHSLKKNLCIRTPPK